MISRTLPVFAAAVTLACGAALAQAPAATPPGGPASPVPFSQWLQNVPDPVAKVEDVAVSADEFRKAVVMTYGRRQMAMGGQRNLPPFSPQEEYNILALLIESRALRLLSDSANIEVTDAELDEAIAQDIEGMGGEAVFATFLEQSGLDKARHRELRKAQLIQQKYSADVLKDITVTDEEVQAEYDKLVANNQLFMPPSAEVRHILIRADMSNAALSEAAKKRAEEIRVRVTDGNEDFAAVATQVSEDQNSKADGGAMLVQQNELRSNFEKSAFQLPIGEVSPVFDSTAGWHIMVVEKRNEPSTVPFDVAGPQIRAGMLGRRQSAELQKHVKAAMEKMKVEIFVQEPDAPATPNQDVNKAFDALLEQSS